MATHETAYQAHRGRFGVAAAGLLHHYGPRVRLLACPVLCSQLAAICQASAIQPQLTYVIKDLFIGLLRAVLADVWPCHNVAVATRMATLAPNKRGIWHGAVLNPHQHAVTVALARAGTVPSQAIFEMLCQLIDAHCVRQDHIYINRVTDERGSVVGVDVTGNKIGGPVHSALVFIPDPMGATGSSINQAIAMYKALPGGAPKHIVAMHLIVTPEYLRAVTAQHPDVLIYALRLDRGMSPPEVMSTPLGALWQQERGLNDQHYIVPGAGGLGEILNNSYV